MIATPSARRLDHLVLPARDLEAQAAFHRRLGFQVGARNIHPWGTENRLVQFDGCFLELITLGGQVAPPDHAPRRFSFGAHVRDWLAAKGDGMSMLVADSGMRRPMPSGSGRQASATTSPSISPARAGGRMAAKPKSPLRSPSRRRRSRRISASSSASSISRRISGIPRCSGTRTARPASAASSSRARICRRALRSCSAGSAVRPSLSPRA